MEADRIQEIVSEDKGEIGVLLEPHSQYLCGAPAPKFILMSKPS